MYLQLARTQSSWVCHYNIVLSLMEFLCHFWNSFYAAMKLEVLTTVLGCTLQGLGQERVAQHHEYGYAHLSLTIWIFFLVASIKTHQNKNHRYSLTQHLKLNSNHEEHLDINRGRNRKARSIYKRRPQLRYLYLL